MDALIIVPHSLDRLLARAAGRDHARQVRDGREHVALVGECIAVVCLIFSIERAWFD